MQKFKDTVMYLNTGWYEELHQLSPYGDATFPELHFVLLQSQDLFSN